MHGCLGITDQSDEVHQIGFEKRLEVLTLIKPQDNGGQKNRVGIDRGMRVKAHLGSW